MIAWPEAVVAPGNDAPAEAALLRDRFPDAAEAAIERGATASSNSWTRARPVQEIAAPHGEAATRFLAGEMEGFMARPEPGSSGVEFEAVKDEDLTGARFVIKLVPGGRAARAQRWETNERVLLGRKRLSESVGAGSYNIPGSRSDFADAAKIAIAGPPETPFEISVRLVA